MATSSAATGSALTGASPRRYAPTRPTCTHQHMDKMYGPFACNLCGKIPNIGFVYACVEDEIKAATESSIVEDGVDATRMKLLTGKKIDADDLQNLGLNHTIVKAAKEGHYTADQLVTLVKQKLNVIDTIKEQQQAQDAVKGKHRREPDAQSKKMVAAMDKSESSSIPQKQQQDKSEDEGANAKSNNAPSDRAAQPCSFRCCHTCRPFSRDRTFVSLDAVVRGEVPIPTAWDPKFMPVHDVNVVRNLGLRKLDPSQLGEAQSGEYDPWATSSSFQTSSSSDENEMPSRFQGLFLRTKSGRENLKAELEEDSPENPADKGFRDSLRRAQQEMIRYRLANSTTLPDEHVIFLFQELDKINMGGDVDLALWKELSDELLQEAAQTKLPKAHGDDELDESGVVPEEEKRIEGGVALTEEAVENNSPDIIMKP